MSNANNTDDTDFLPLVTVIAPAYNEAGILHANLSEICDYMQTLEGAYRWELIVVDDGSTDETAAIARTMAGARENIRVHHHQINCGLGCALRSGFSEARGDYIVVIDIDLTYSTEHIGRLLEKISGGGADIVVASPYMAGGKTSDIPFLRRFLSRWGNRFLAMTARGANHSGDISTLTGMVRVYDARFIRSLNLKSMGMEINTEIIYKGTILGARIEEIPAHLDWGQHANKQAQRTSSKRIRRSIRFSLFAGFIIRPFAFFIVPAVVLALISTYPLFWIGHHVITQYQEMAAGLRLDYTVSQAVALAFQQAPHAFFIGGVTLMLSVQLFSLGIISLQVKQYFEESFHFGTRIYSHSLEIERLLKERESRDHAVTPDSTHD